MPRAAHLDRSCYLVAALATTLAACGSSSESGSTTGPGGGSSTSSGTTSTTSSGTTSSGSTTSSGTTSSGSASSGSTSSSSGTASSSSTSSSGGASCDPNAWVYMGNDPNACVGHLGESCGWTTTNGGQGYHCQTVSWGTGCEPGGTTCPNGSSSSSTSSSSSSSSSSGTSTSSSSSSSTSSGSTSSSGGNAPVFSPYKDVGINMDWNTNVVSTKVGGAMASVGADLVAQGGKTITLAFATGECGTENWAGVQGDAMATANVAKLAAAGAKYIVSTGGAAGSFTCGSDAGMTTFINRWAGAGLVGIDFDIEAGQSQAVIDALIARIKAAHGTHAGLRFSLTLGTLANNNGASTAQSLGAGAPDSFNTYGDEALASVKSQLGFNGSPSTWPSYLTVNLMTMDYGSPGPGVCVVSGGRCQMGQSAMQAAYNLHDKWGVPYSNIELTPMIGGNDAQDEVFSLADVDTMTQFVLQNGLAGVHYWSYDRDDDCAPGPSSSTCNSLGTAGTYGFLKRFLAAGLH